MDRRRDRRCARVCRLHLRLLLQALRTQRVRQQQLQLASLVHPVDRSTVFSQPSNILGSFFSTRSMPATASWSTARGFRRTSRWAASSGIIWPARSMSPRTSCRTASPNFHSNLIYQGESGALNESFSDMMGTSVEFFYPAGRQRAVEGRLPDRRGRHHPRRHPIMANPDAFGEPDHYSQRLTTIRRQRRRAHESGIGNQGSTWRSKAAPTARPDWRRRRRQQQSRADRKNRLSRVHTVDAGQCHVFDGPGVTIQAANDLYGAEQRGSARSPKRGQP